jgi:hypothetical protein
MTGNIHYCDIHDKKGGIAWIKHKISSCKTVRPSSSVEKNAMGPAITKQISNMKQY